MMTIKERLKDIQNPRFIVNTERKEKRETRYKKQIRGMIEPPTLPGMNNSSIILTDWKDEDEISEKELEDWNQVIKLKDKMSRLYIEERYVRV